MVYIGIFTRKARIVINHLIDRDGRRGAENDCIIMKRDLFVLYIRHILISRGSEAVIVYSIIYIPA